MSGDHETLVRGAIARDPVAVRGLVALLRPTIQVRVARGLMRNPHVRAAQRSAAQEVEDMIQEVFLSLFDDDAKALRAWRPERLGLQGFVGMLAEHQVASILRSGRRRPWRDEHADGVEPDVLPSLREAPEAQFATRELLRTIVERLRAELTPKGFDLFTRLLVDDQPVEQACAELGMTRDAIYAWRSRLQRRVRELGAELAGEKEAS